MPVCLIVGAGPGVGSAVARRFGREGFRLGLIARRAGSLEELTGELAAQGLEASNVPADAADPESLAAAIEQASARLGAPDVLVYNAAGATPALPSELKPEQLVRDLRVSVVGALVAAQAVIPPMRERGRGTILLTGGGFAFEPIPTMCSLGVGKAGLRNLAFSLAKELEPSGIHAATVTIAGVVKPGTPFDPAAIAEAFWTLHEQRPGAFEREVVFRPDA